MFSIRKWLGSTLALALLLASVNSANAQTCNGQRFRYRSIIPAYSAEWYGDWEYIADPSQGTPIRQRACEKFADRFGLIYSKLRYPPELGYFGHGYDSPTLYSSGGGCAYRAYATHPDYGTQSVMPGAGNESQNSQCPQDPLKNRGNPCGIGNPIDPATGNKYQAEKDYRAADGTLEFTRHYNSLLQTQFVSALGSRWRSTYDRFVRRSAGSASIIYVHRPDGKILTFIQVENQFISEGDITDRLEKFFDPSGAHAGWRYTESITDEVENYDADGRLLTIRTRSGITSVLAYDGSGRLASVTEPFGKALLLGYDASSRLSTLTVPGGLIYRYSYGENNNVSAVTHPDGTTRSYLYNESAYTSGVSQPTALTGIVDENNSRYATFRYNSSQRALSTEHGNGAEKYQIQYPQDGNDNTRIFTDPLGTSRTLTLSTVLGVSHVVASSDKSDLSCSRFKHAEYDDHGNTTSTVEFNDSETTYTFEPTRNLENSRTEAAGTPRARTIATQWHPTYRLPTRIDESGRRTSFTHDANGNVLTRTEVDTETNDSRVWAYTYNHVGRILAADGPRTDVSDVTTYTYNECSTGYECGQLHTITNAAGHMATYTSYNAHGQPLTMTDPNGVVTVLTYDLRQRLTSRTVGAEVTTFEYWLTGLLRKVTLPDGSYLEYTYDAAHRLVEINDSTGNRMVYTLDAMGNRTQEDLFDPLGALTQVRHRVFDALNRLHQEIGAANTSAVASTYSYDDNGNLTGVVAPLGRGTSQAYDELNRLAKITDPLSGVTEYSYSPLDQLIDVTDPRGVVTRYTYNALGDLTLQVSPDTGVMVYTHDSAGNVLTRTDGRGTITTQSYDALNRLTSTTYPDQTIHYAYDEGAGQLGRLTEITDSSGSTRWIYDAQGRVLSRQQSMGIIRSVGYIYDASGQLQTQVLPSGNTIRYVYIDGRVTGLVLNTTTTILSNVLYQPFGPTRGWTWGNGTLAVREYDEDGKITGLDSAGLRNYVYDDAFRITSIADADDSARSQNYSYDLLDRLTTVASDELNQSWIYDANGNRLSQGGSEATAYTTASASNRLTGISGAFTRTYAYDGAGSVIGDGMRDFVYDAAGRMVAVTNGATTTTYAHNALGQRVKKVSGAISRYFVYDEAGHLLGEYDSVGTLIQETIWLGETPVATLRPTGSGVGLFYVHTDHLETPRRISRPSDNTIVWRWDSDPFGTTAASEDPDGDGQLFSYGLRFPGQYYDPETGLHYNYFRDYDPSTGRYVESDPIGLKGGINTYAYAFNRPVSLTDPRGLCPCWGGSWKVDAGDLTLSGAFGGYISFGAVSFTCKSNPTTKCQAQVFCIGGGPIIGGGAIFSIAGSVNSASDGRQLGGWSGWQVATSVGPVSGQADGSGGWSIGAGLSAGAGLAAVKCNTFSLNCQCACEK